MMDTGTETTTSETNGATPPATATEGTNEAPKTEKPKAKRKKSAKGAKVAPWIAAGFKTQEEYRVAMRAKKRKAKEEKKAARKAAKPAKAKKPAKKPAKKAAASKKAASSKKSAKSKKEASKNYPTTAAERRKSALRTAKFMKATSKRTEPNKDEAKLWKSVKIGTETNTDKLAECFSGPSAKRHSRVRNALRWLRASGKFKPVKKSVVKNGKTTHLKGIYRRVA